MYQFFLCKANIIDWKVKPKNRLFSPFFYENVSNPFMATLALLMHDNLFQTSRRFGQKYFCCNPG